MNNPTILETCEKVAPELVQAGITEVMEQNARLWEEVYRLKEELKGWKEIAEIWKERFYAKSD